MGDFYMADCFKADFFIKSRELIERLGLPGAPLVFDVRRQKAFEADRELLPTALWRDHRTAADWADEISARTPVVVYCVHGEQVSQSTVAALRSRGIRAQALRGGIEAWRAAGGSTVPRDLLPQRDAVGATRWVLPLEPSAIVVGQAWFLKRFVDPLARFFFVEADQVEAAAAELDATPLVPRDGASDRPGVADLLVRLARDHTLLARFAEIAEAPGPIANSGPGEAAGFQALVEGSRDLPGGEAARLERGLGLCDALYAWLRYQASMAGDAGGQA